MAQLRKFAIRVYSNDINGRLIAAEHKVAFSAFEALTWYLQSLLGLKALELTSREIRTHKGRSDDDMVAIFLPEFGYHVTAEHRDELWGPLEDSLAG